MSKKKNHHYIPKFYLKRFSTNALGKNISLYNHKNKIFIREAPIKNQACAKYLYGVDDEIENALAKMEDKIAKMFYYWTEEKLLYPPPDDSNGYKLLKRFIIYQAFRTPNSGKKIEDGINESVMKFLKEFQLGMWEKLKGSTIKFKNPVLLALSGAIKHEKLLNYLECRFVVNLSDLPLILSDSPVIFYNQLLEKANNYIGATSLVSKGLQVFLPIHPRLLICLYDSRVYEFDNDAKNCSSTESIEEIHQLNSLQLINSNSQVFFNEFISKEYIEILHKQNKKYRSDFKNINTVLNHNDKKLFLMSSKDPQIKLSLGFFKLKVNPNRYTNAVSPLRHHSFVRNNTTDY